MTTDHTGGGEFSRTDNVGTTTGTAGRVAVLAASVVLAVLLLSLSGPAAGSEHTNGTTFTATNTGGELRVAGEQLFFPAGDIVITGVAEDGTWESTDIEFAEQSVRGFTGEVTAPDGLSGTFDREEDVFTLEGTLVITILDTDIEAEIDGSSENAAIPTQLRGSNPQAAVNDGDFVVDETGNTLIDGQLGLPADDTSKNFLRLPLRLSYEDTGSDETGDDTDTNTSLPEGAEVTVTTDSSGRRSVQARVPDARGGRSIDVPVDDSASDERFSARNLSVTPRDDGTVSINATSGTDELDTTPAQRAGFAPNTTALGYVSVETNLADDEIEEFTLTARVDRERLQSLGSDPGAVSLYRFNESRQQWVEQNTTVVEQTEESVLLRAVADHPSEWTTAAARPEFEIAQTDVEVTAARVGESVAIDVVVENTGGTEGRYRADLLLNGEVVDSQETVIADGGQALFDFQPAFEEEGTHEVQVNDVPIDEIEVTAEGATTDDTEQSTADGQQSNGDSSADGGGNGFGIAAAVIAALTAGLYARRRDY